MDSWKIDPDRLVFASEAALAVRVSKQLVNSWVNRGLLKPVDEKDGRRRYRLGDAMKVELATRRSGCSSRAKTYPRQRALAAAAQLERDRLLDARS